MAEDAPLETPDAMRGAPGPPSTEDTSPVLVMGMEHLGDIVNTVPALRAIRRHHPHSHIVVQVGERTPELLDGCPYVDEVWSRPTAEWPWQRAAVAWRLRAGRFGAVYILARCNDKILLVWLAGVRRRYGIRKTRFHSLYTASVTDDGTGHERLDVFRDLLSSLGLDVCDWRTELWLTEEEATRASQVLANAGWDGSRRLVGLCVGASLARRMWKPAGFAAVGDGLADEGSAVVLLGSRAEREMAQQVRRSMRAPAIDLAGALGVRDLVAVLSLCDAAVACDTGPMHIAAALGVPVVALYGPSDPRRTGPAGDGHIVIRSRAACGGPCPERPVGACDCMAAIEPDAVLGAIRTVLDNRAGTPGVTRQEAVLSR